MDRITSKKIAVMGYLCLDLFPDFKGKNIFKFIPGMLQEVGSCDIFPGGVIGNTGLALHKLGMPVKLVGRVGNDVFGQIVKEILGQLISESDFILKIGVGKTAYSIVLSSHGDDRMFLANSGVNETLTVHDADALIKEDIGLLHFGYPPLCRLFAIKNGQELQKLFKRAKKQKIVTSLDLSLPAPNSFSYSLDWISFLRKTMPLTDVFLPSLDELSFMLKPKRTDTLSKIQVMAEQLLDFGAAIVGIKLGGNGLYVKTTNDINRLKFLSTISIETCNLWRNKEFIAPCRQVKVVGTTGAGDATVAGFLAGIMTGCTAEISALLGVGTGACNVTSHDSISGIKPLSIIRKMLYRGWPSQSLSFNSGTTQIISVEQMKVAFK